MNRIFTQLSNGTYDYIEAPKGPRDSQCCEDCIETVSAQTITNLEISTTWKCSGCQQTCCVNEVP